MVSTESSTDCLTCKTEHEKLDGTEPHCLRCQQSRVECYEYINIEHPNKITKKGQTFPVPRTVVGHSQAITHQETPLVNTRVPAESTNISIQSASSSSFSRSIQHTLVGCSTSDPLAVNTTNYESVQAPPSTDVPLTSGSTSLSEKLFGLDQPLDALQHARPTTSPSSPSISSWSLPITEGQDGVTTHEEEDLEGVVGVVYRQLVLDRTAESNALPFVLQGYASWISRVALDPLKMTGASREFVCSQFGDGEQSRWIIALLANIGSRIGSVEFVEARPARMLSLLQTAVRRQLGAIKSRPNPKKFALVKVLEAATEATVIQLYASPVSEAMTLLHETAPVFRRLCPEPPGAPISLQSLLEHPSSSLWHYAEMDIVTSVLSDMPTRLPYKVAIPGSQLSDSYRSVAAAIHNDGIVQWLRGMPNQILIIFAHMKSMHQNGITPDEETVTSLEQDIREVSPFSGSASDRFLVVMRSVVQECWRQAAFVYLYMAVCGDSSDTPRVKEACKRYMRLLKGIKPGRLPDEYLLLTLQLISSAAQQPRDREVIKQRALALRSRDRTHGGTIFVILVMEGVWALADAEGRPIMWSDKAISRRRVMDMLLSKR